jgi:NTE family protein
MTKISLWWRTTLEKYVHFLPIWQKSKAEQDIIFCDKNMDNIKMSKLITRHIQLIESLYEIFEKFDQSKLDPEVVKRIKTEYNTLIDNYGAEIRSVTRVIRSEIESPSVLQNADFSPKTIKELISQGERKTVEKLAYCDTLNYDFNK